jgi:hypothetical protein
MGTGLFTVVVLLILAVVLGVFPEFSDKFRMLPPLEQNLTRAANGFALMVTLVVGIYWLGAGPFVFFADLEDFGAHPGDHWVPITTIVLFCYAALRCIQGVCACWGCQDAPLTNRSYFTTAFGILAAWFLWGHQSTEFLSNFWLAFGWFCLLVICAWTALTGAVRLFLLTGCGAITAIQASIGRIRGSAAASSGLKRLWRIINMIGNVLFGTILFGMFYVGVLEPAIGAWQKGQDPLDAIKANWARIQARDEAQNPSASAAPESRPARKHYVDKDGKQWW